MSKILYIKASPRTGRSHAIAVAEAFIDAYREANPGDAITTIDIFQKDLPNFDLEAVTAKYKIMHDEEHSDQDIKVWAKVEAIIDEFKAADKYVLAVPMWNFSIPYRLKQYIDIIVQPGYTFTVDDEGKYQGLIKGKPVFIAYASGGEYTKDEGSSTYDMQKSYLELILGFMGLTDIRKVIVEPTLGAGAEVARQKKEQAIKKAKGMAGSF